MDGDGSVDSIFSDASSMKSLEEKKENTNKYKDFRIPNYPISNRDMMGLANCLKRYNKGVKQGKRSTLRRVNKYKIGVVFERPGLANAALQNKKFLEAYNLTVSIPAAASEVTGVITHVPTELSNEQIYSALTSTNNIVSIRRFIRRSRTDNGENKLEPTKTVSITFSCPVLPESVDHNNEQNHVCDPPRSGGLLRHASPPSLNQLRTLRSVRSSSRPSTRWYTRATRISTARTVPSSLIAPSSEGTTLGT
ncbi:hypothetical protein ACJJTC_007300 [Scirpophaga incertulas]